MFRRFLFYGVAALVLLVALNTPGPLQAQRFRGSFPRAVPTPSSTPRVSPGFRGGSTLRFNRSFGSFNPRFDRRFSRGPFDRRFDSRFDRRFDSLFRRGIFDRRFGGGWWNGAWTGGAYPSASLMAGSYPSMGGSYPSGSSGYPDSASSSYPDLGNDPSSLYGGTYPYSPYGGGAAPNLQDTAQSGEASSDSAAPSPEEQQLSRLLTASGVPNDNGRLRWPLGLRILGGPDSGHEAGDLRDQIDALFQVGVEQAATGKVDAEVRQQISRAVDRLQRLLNRDRDERFALSASIYDEADRFLNDLKRRGEPPGQPESPHESTHPSEGRSKRGAADGTDRKIDVKERARS